MLILLARFDGLRCFSFVFVSASVVCSGRSAVWVSCSFTPVLVCLGACVLCCWAVLTPLLCRLVLAVSAPAFDFGLHSFVFCGLLCLACPLLVALVVLVPASVIVLVRVVQFMSLLVNNFFHIHIYLLLHFYVLRVMVRYSLLLLHPFCSFLPGSSVSAGLARVSGGVAGLKVQLLCAIFQ